MIRQTTLKELAKISGCSVSTISKALNGSREISPETREKILLLAKSHNYVPNSIAQVLKTKRTKTIGVLIPDVLSFFFAKALYGIEEEASSQGYHILTCITNESTEKEIQSLKRLCNGTVDGFILSIAAETASNRDYGHFLCVQEMGLPIVMFDRVTEDIECDKVVIDDFDASFRATNHLLCSNRQHIAFLTNFEKVSISKLRIKGYLEAMKAAHREPLVIEIDSYKDYAQTIMERLKSYKIDALVAGNELSAVLAMNIVKDLGYRVPKDIAIVGFTNGLMSEHASPPISSISQNAVKMGAKAAQMLIARLEKKCPLPPFSTSVVPSDLIIRNSSFITDQN